LVILALLFCGSVAAQQIDLTGWFPFNPSVAVSAASAVDASDLLVDVPGEDPAQVIGLVAGRTFPLSDVRASGRSSGGSPVMFGCRLGTGNA
jgi:hypothetical protein